MPILLLLLVAMAVEITVMVLVGSAIGVLPTILALIAASLIGSWLLRREGTRALSAFRDAMVSRKPPHKELIDGMLIAAAAVLVVIPGFVSDAVALFLLFPPTRAIVRRRLVRRAEARNTTTIYVDGEVVDQPRYEPPHIVIPEAREP